MVEKEVYYCTLQLIVPIEAHPVKSTMSSEEALACRKKVRAAHRSAQACALIEATPVDTDELALLQTNLSTKLTTLEALNTEIVELTPEAQPEEEIGRADEYSERMQRTLLHIHKALNVTCLCCHLLMTHFHEILPRLIRPR